MTILIDLVLVATGYIGFQLFIITEAIQSTIFGCDLIVLHLKVCETCLKFDILLAVHVLKLLTVSCRKCVFQINGFLFQLENEPKVERQSKGNEHDRKGQSHIELRIPDVLFLPDDILRLRCLNQINFFLEDCLSLEVQQLVLGGAQVHALIPSELCIESDESTYYGKQIFFGMLLD